MERSPVVACKYMRKVYGTARSLRRNCTILTRGLSLSMSLKKLAWEKGHWIGFENPRT